MLELILIAIAIVSYLIGSINSAIIVGKIKSSGDDIRNHGSGNAGATNALRTYGKSAAAFVVLGDCLKSAISCIVAIIVAYNTSLGVENVKLGIYAAGIGAVLGHNFPLYFGFKGGKGIL
ncbi:MAG: glycerol-3-phosphate acyltransferase, partial [Monoglobaceae bacterium]